MNRKTPLTDQLRKIIKKCGMSRYAICKATKTDQGTMSRFMAGTSGLSFKSLVSIGELLDLRIIAAPKAPKRKGR